jgi:hypothetical protein
LDHAHLIYISDHRLSDLVAGILESAALPWRTRSDILGCVK